MSDDDLFGERRPRKKRKPGSSSGETVKTLLIVFGVLAGVSVLACCGVFGAGYYVVKKNFSQLALTQPAEIQKLTAELTDIAIPPEFVARHGTSIFGVKTVIYQWCPTGTCPAQADHLGSLSLSSFQIQTAEKPNANVLTVTDEQFTDDALKHSWFEYGKSVYEVDIRGKKCKFHVVRGEQLDGASMIDAMEEEEDEEGVTVITVDPQGEPANTPQAAPARKGSGRKSVQVRGSFPGKMGEVTLELHLAEEDYQEDKIRGMLRSIR